jgi:CDP-diacylglycerol--glycerol-3-phosphate 3-phosphatidyltransferase
VIDLACSLAIAVLAVTISLAYARRVSRFGAARHPRVEQAGSSFLLGQGAMQMGYWALGPVRRACIALGVSANAVSWTSLTLAAGSGVSLARGHLGVGAALSLLSSACDALDGMIARETGTASESGEVLDATVDRYAELLFLGGLAYWGRTSAVAIGLALAATAGAVMVSYSTAKAESLRVPAPRGAMRRQERAVYLVLGVALYPLAQVAVVRWGLRTELQVAPVLAALALVATVGNASAVRRLSAIARAVRAPSRVRASQPNAAEGLGTDGHVTASDALR